MLKFVFISITFGQKRDHGCSFKSTEHFLFWIFYYFILWQRKILQTFLCLSFYVSFLPLGTISNNKALEGKHKNRKFYEIKSIVKALIFLFLLLFPFIPFQRNFWFITCSGCLAHLLSFCQDFPFNLSTGLEKAATSVEIFERK